MALDIQIPYRGDQYLFQGISGGAAGLASGAEAAIKKYKQKQDAGKAADYFMKAGGDEMYQQAGIHPEEWKTLGAEDKARAVQAIMEQGTMKRMQAQLEDMHAQAAERRQMGAARQQQMQLAQDEAEGMPRLADAIMAQRGAGGPAAPGPDVDPGGEMSGGPGPAPMTRTGNFSPEEIMTGIQSMGKTNPKLAAALSRTLIPKLMDPANGGPQSWRSPEGHPYVWMGHNLMADKPPFDPSEMMGAVPNGYQAMPDGRGGVRVLPEKKPIDAPTQLPAAFWSKLDKLGDTYQQAKRRGAYSDGEAKKYLTGKTTPEEFRTRMKADTAAAQQEIQQHLGAFESEGYGKPETWQMLKKRYGMAAAAATATGTPAAGTPAKPTAPKVGEVRGGYTFKGGNPADPKNWEKPK